MSRLLEWFVAFGIEQYAGFFVEHRIDLIDNTDLTRQIVAQSTDTLARL